MSRCATEGCRDAAFRGDLCGWCYRDTTGKCPTCADRSGECQAYQR